MGTGEHLVGVGWLERGHDFPKGAIQASALDNLRQVVASPWELIATRGFHACSLCWIPRSRRKVEIDGQRFVLGCRNLWVPTGEHVFVAPSLILHYVVRHNYLPPHPFLKALRGLPTPGSQRYLELLAASGPPEYRVYTDQSFRRVRFLLEAISSVTREPNPSARIEDLRTCVDSAKRPLGGDAAIDRDVRALLADVDDLAPPEPRPHPDFPFVDRWGPVRKLVLSLLDRWRHPSSGPTL